MMAKYQLLSAQECDQIVETLNQDDGAHWEPGVSPSDDYQERVKRNLEQPMGDDDKPASEIGKYVVNKIMECNFFTRRTLPKHLGRPRFNLYQNGGEYGRHADSAFMGHSPEIRTDLSMTIFLTDPDSYVGGDLVLEYTSGAVISLKEPKGMMVFYPSGVMHHVKPVTEGQRICFITWVESHIQDPSKRDILVEITNLCDDMGKVESLGDIHMRMTNIKHNLFRQWMRLA